VAKEIQAAPVGAINGRASGHASSWVMARCTRCILTGTSFMWL